MTQRVQTQREVKKHLFRFACRPLLLSLSLSCVFVDKYSCAPKVGGGGNSTRQASERERETAGDSFVQSLVVQNRGQIVRQGGGLRSRRSCCCCGGREESCCSAAAASGSARHAAKRENNNQVWRSYTNQTTQ